MARFQGHLLGAAVMAMALAVAACSETWEGAKEDTRENVRSTEQGAKQAGQNIERMSEDVGDAARDQWRKTEDGAQKAGQNIERMSDDVKEEVQ